MVVNGEDVCGISQGGRVVICEGASVVTKPFHYLRTRNAVVIQPRKNLSKSLHSSS